MKAVVHDKSQKPLKLAFRDVPRPEPLNDQILVKVICSSINAADYRSLNMGMIPKTKIFGASVTGIVEQIGNGVTSFKVGDEVLGDLSDFGFGGFAEFAIAPEQSLVIKPTTLSFEKASSLPVAATTALKGLRDSGNIQEGQDVLIVGGSGGVGVFAIQLAKHFGASITVVCSSKNVEQSLKLGAGKVIDYKKEDFTETKQRFDLILAINGNNSLLDYKRLLKPTGIYVMIGGSMSQIFRSILFGWMHSFGSKKMRSLAAKSDPKDLEFVAKLMAEGKIDIPIEQHYSLDQTIEAMEYVGQGHCPNKVVIHVASDE